MIVYPSNLSQLTPLVIIFYTFSGTMKLLRLVFFNGLMGSSHLKMRFICLLFFKRLHPK